MTQIFKLLTRVKITLKKGRENGFFSEKMLKYFGKISLGEVFIKVQKGWGNFYPPSNS